MDSFWLETFKIIGNQVFSSDVASEILRFFPGRIIWYFFQSSYNGKSIGRKLKKPDFLISQLLYTHNMTWESGDTFKIRAYFYQALFIFQVFCCVCVCVCNPTVTPLYIKLCIPFFLQLSHWGWESIGLALLDLAFGWRHSACLQNLWA